MGKIGKYLYRYHPVQQMQSVARYGLESYSPEEVNRDRRARGEDMDGWPEPEDEVWVEDQSRAPRIYFATSRWGPQEDRVEIRVPAHYLQGLGLYGPDQFGDYFVEGRLTISPDAIEINSESRGSSWKSLTASRRHAAHYSAGAPRTKNRGGHESSKKLPEIGGARR